MVQRGDTALDHFPGQYSPTISAPYISVVNSEEAKISRFTYLGQNSNYEFIKSLSSKRTKMHITMMKIMTISLMMTLLSLKEVSAEPHLELGEDDSPCLHKPCQHGVCVQTSGAGRGYQCFCEGRISNILFIFIEAKLRNYFELW